MLIFSMRNSIDFLMKKYPCQRIRSAVFSAILTLGIVHNAQAAPAQKPLFQTNSVKPIMMLNMSKDHQMFFKVYDDYSDITDPNGGAPDGKPDTTYVPKYEYYGYFDGKKCYQYSSGNYFEPVALADADHYCVATNKQWSGNFLNWATMTRIDAIRKILFGGLRSIDDTSSTILERAFLPHDAHSFAKYYNGPNIDQLTPFNTVTSGTAMTDGITFCNVTPIDGANNASQNNTKPPLIRVAKGNYSLWASNESRQCQWDSASNANVAANSGIEAYDKAPASNSADKLSASNKYADGEYAVKVKVCVSGFEESECKQYPQASSAKKPIGLFQEFGEAQKILFGLMTGSYAKNKSGGVLRKTVGNLSNEIDLNTGVFLGNPGAIKVLNSLRIYGYDYAGNNYGGGAYDNCPFGLSAFNNGSCTNWGNPQAEIYLESLRYLSSYRTSANLTANSAFSVSSPDKVPGVTVESWGTPPVTAANYCAPLNVLQFNASSSTFDDDEMAKETDLGLPVNGVKTWTDLIGGATREGLTGSFFTGIKDGGTGSELNGICTGKTFSSLSKMLGSCPDAPRLKGSYGIAGLAYYARTNDINPDLINAQNVRTFGVSLAPAVPAIKIPVPGTSGATQKYVEVLPACKNERPSTAGPIIGEREGNCAIVDFKIVATNIDSSNTTNTAKLYVNWEVAEQGNDYDQDMWGTIDISVTNATASVQTRILKMSASPKIGFGYVISGTESDGFKASSGANNFVEPGTYCSAPGLCNCPNGACAQVAPAQVYNIGSSSSGATFLPSALSLAAKWGGFSAAFEKEAQNAAALASETYDADFLAKKIKTRNYKDSYYFATDPRALAKSLRDAFDEIAAGIGAASSVATVSARVSDGDLVYQAQFNSEDWTGDLYAYQFDAAGNVKPTPKYCTSDLIVASSKVCTGQMPKSSSGRTIYITKGTGLDTLSWSNLSTDQQNGLKLLSESTYDNAKKRLSWLAGDATDEDINTGGILRSRGTGSNRNILGDIVNSSPVYVGEKNFRYESLPGAAGSSYKTFLLNKKSKPKYIIVGSNDGMVHAFNATTLEELFAFIPTTMFSRAAVTDDGTKLTNLTNPNYGSGVSNPHVYSVDGPITYSDVYINGDWRRVIVGTFGAGGRSIYALDVTDSTPSLLFELNYNDNPGAGKNKYPELGYVMGKPVIAPMKNGRWAVIFGNGSDSTKTSHLIVIDLESPLDPAYSKVIDTGEGTGLSAPALQVNSIGQALTVYAGDVDGNLWKFDLNNSNISNWAKDYKVFKAVTTASASTSQPIFAAPTLGVNAQKDYKTMVYFGTGKYYDTGDTSAGIPVQSFYAILDKGSTVDRSELLQKTLTTTGTTDRKVSTTNPSWATQNGWYLDFDALGERVTTKALLLFDKLIFPTLIPTTAQCDAGGASWLMEVPAVGDKYTNSNVLNPNLYTTSLVLGNLNYVTVNKGAGGVIVKNQSNGVVATVPASPIKPLEGRESWRQIQ